MSLTIPGNSVTSWE